MASISGIRGIYNKDLLPADIIRYTRNFACIAASPEVLVGRDTRPTGELIEKVVKGTLLEAGRGVVDYGVISTPALFRESRVLERPALIVTASHNEPEWNGLKFLLNGRGVNQAEFDQIIKPSKKPVQAPGVAATRPGPKPSYVRDLVAWAGEGSCEGLRVAVDLNGGAATAHTPAVLRALGCDLTVLGGTPGIFSRAIDPTNDDLALLASTVKERGCAVGFAFDCDGDRLVLVDGDGKKRTGDQMLTVAVKELLPGLRNRAVVVSADTTQAIDEVVSALGGRTYRSKVGEANVISRMGEEKAEIGGEGSSGGLIDARFNLCRDSMLAAITIAKGIRRRGARFLDQVPSYHQVRLKVPAERKRAFAAIRKLQKENPGADTLDGIKISVSNRAWVLIRMSGTEDIVRVSAEAPSLGDAQGLADTYVERLKRVS